jgi:ribosome-associated protein
MILEFDVTHSAVLSSYQKRRITERLGRRINQRGVLRLQAQRYRMQSANRADLLERFVMLLHSALRPVTNRIPTRVPTRIREQRLQAKKQRTQTKRIRQTPRNVDEA